MPKFGFVTSLEMPYDMALTHLEFNKLSKMTELVCSI